MSARNKAETLASVMKETIVTQKQLCSSKVKSGDNDVEEMIVDDVNEELIESRKAAKIKTIIPRRSKLSKKAVQVVTFVRKTLQQMINFETHKDNEHRKE